MNSKRGGVTLKNGDEEIIVRISTNAMVRYQDLAGETFLSGFNALQEDPSDIRRLRNLFWASVSDIDGMTPDRAGDLLDDLGYKEAFPKVSEAVALAFPESKKEEKATKEGESAGNVKPGKSAKVEKAPATT